MSTITKTWNTDKIRSIIRKLGSMGRHYPLLLTVTGGLGHYR